MVLQAACQEVQASQLLIQLLQAVLGVGNYLNQGTFKGNAPGLAPSSHSCSPNPAVFCGLPQFLVQAKAVNPAEGTPVVFNTCKQTPQFQFLANGCGAASHSTHLAT